MEAQLREVYGTGNVEARWSNRALLQSRMQVLELLWLWPP